MIMTLLTFARNCANMETTQLRIRLMGKSYNSADVCEFIYFGDYEKVYLNGFWNGANENKKTPKGNIWKYTTFDHVSAYDNDSIIVYVSEPQEWKPYFNPNLEKNVNLSEKPNSNSNTYSYRYGRKKENNLL